MITTGILKKKWFLPLMALVGALLLIIPQLLQESTDDAAKTSDIEDVTYYSDMLEDKICDLVSKVSGVGEVSVVITLDSGSENVYAANTKISESQSATDYLVIKKGDGEGGLVVGQICPKVRGVAVVCGGGSSPSVQNEVTQLIAAALGIPTSRIKVCGQE